MSFMPPILDDLSEKTIDRLHQSKFEANRTFAAATAFACAGLACLMWGWDYVVDPVHAPATIPYRAVFFIIFSSFAYYLYSDRFPRARAAAFITTIISSEIIFVLILNQLDGGHIFGAGAFLYWFLFIPLIGVGFSLRLNLFSLATIPFPPLVMYALGYAPNLPVTVHFVYSLSSFGVVAIIVILSNRMILNLMIAQHHLAFARDQALELVEMKHHLQEEAEAATKARGEFLANMSHEIRTPMNAVIGLSHLALKSGLNAKQNDYLKKIDSSANALLGIINDILDFSKIEAGKLDMEHVPFNIEDVLDGLSALIASKAEAKGLKLIITCPDTIPRHLIGDPLRLGQVLTNLVGNAIKYTEAGEVSVSVNLNRETANKVSLGFEIKDTGIGLSEEQISRLFQSFAQADTSTTRLYGGTGLGLSISKQLVKLMGGVIGVHSVLEEGSRFFFTVDLGLGSIETTAQTKQVYDMDYMDFSGKHILLADDHELNQLVAREILENVGFSVTVVGNGKEAVDALCAQDSAFDLVLMDIQMPVMDGYTATNIIRSDARFKDLPIIALTSHAMKGEREKSISKGLNEHITKPINPDVLFKIIANWITPGEATEKVADAVDTGISASENNLPDHLPPFDIPAALKRLSGKRDLLFTLLIKFHDIYVDIIPTLRKMLDDGKFEDATRLAHTLRGGAGALEAQDVFEICTQLEAALDENRSGDIPTLVANLEAAMVPAIEAAASLKP